MRHLLSLSLLFAACGSPDTTEVTMDPVVVEGTSGSESTTPPVVLRTTTPVPVPQPAVAREELSEALQEIWQKVEEVVAIRPPDPPTDGAIEEVQAWASGPFSVWIRERTAASQVVRDIAGEFQADDSVPMYERVVGAALFGYMYEDMAAGVRGAPVPDSVSNDPELIQIYINSLTSAIQPVARVSMQSYIFCAEQVVRELAETDWAHWAGYCHQRAAEVNEGYDLTPASAEEPAEPETQPETQPEAQPESPEEISANPTSSERG